MSTDLWVPALFIGVGILGIVVPLVPGLLLALAGVLIWSLDTATPLAYVVLAGSVAWYAVGLAVKYLLPSRRLSKHGVGTATLVLAVIIGIVGFFVVPVVGAPLGFVLGVYLIERVRAHDGAIAWERTKHALRAVVLSMGIELVTGLLIAVTWGFGAYLDWNSTR